MNTIKTESRRLPFFVAFAFTVSMVMLLGVLLCDMEAAYALNSDEVKTEFNSSELGDLFVEADGYGDSQFVMRSCGIENRNYYLKVKDEYRSRFDAIVGDDLLDILSVQEDEAMPLAVFDDRPLEQVDATAAPWESLLCTRGVVFNKNEGGDVIAQGSAFAVGNHVAVTAAHCVSLEHEPSVNIAVTWHCDVFNIISNSADAAYIIVPKAYLDREVGYASYDYALLVFDEDIANNPGFSYDSISVAGLLFNRLNCAGFPGTEDVGGNMGQCACRNLSDGGYSALKPYKNLLHIDLSIEHGMSGGPTYYIDGEGRYIAVAINSRAIDKDADTGNDELVDDGDPTDDWNYACRITESFECLIAWACEGGCQNVVNPSGSGSGGAGGNWSSTAGGSLLDTYREAKEQQTA